MKVWPIISSGQVFMLPACGSSGIPLNVSSMSGSRLSEIRYFILLAVSRPKRVFGMLLLRAAKQMLRYELLVMDLSSLPLKAPTRKLTSRVGAHVRSWANSLRTREQWLCPPIIPSHSGLWLPRHQGAASRSYSQILLFLLRSSRITIWDSVATPATLRSLALPCGRWQNWTRAPSET